MTDREEVIKGLEICSAGEWNSTGGRDHTDCPYYPAGYTGCTCKLLMRDALALLKELEPRVLTLAELWHMEHKPVYLQRKNSRLYMVEPAIVLTTERCYIPSLGDSYTFMRENKIRDKYWAYKYNVTWRCWTARPTDVQREAVKWDE